MAKVIIERALVEEIKQTFRGRAPEIFEHLRSLAENPTKGKTVGQVAGIVIKELKYENFRFYFVTDGYKLAFYKIEQIEELLITFVRMSDKKTQQKTIEEIKEILKRIGMQGFK